MNVTLDKTGNVSATLTVSIVENDYQEKVKKELKEIGKRHVIPGFRQGHVPFGELNRRFGKQVTSDVINHEVYETVVNYIRDNKLAILGEPLPVEVKELDLKNEKDFTFQYEIGLSPEMDIVVDKNLHVSYVNIDVTDEMINEQDASFRERFGAQVPGEQFEPKALVKGTMMELNADGSIKEGEGAIQNLSAIVAPMYFKGKDEGVKFEGKKVGDKVVFNPWNTCDGNVAELASMLNVSKEVAGDVKADFEMAISEIIVVRPAELNQEYFDNVLGKGKASNEEEYRAGIKAMISAELSRNSEMMFRIDTEKAMVEKWGNVELPDTFLKKWLMARNESLTDENIEAEYEKMIPSLKWQLIKERVAALCEVKIEENDVMNQAKMVAASQFAQYGMTGMDDATISDYAKRLLENKEYRSRIIEEVGDAKLFVAIKEKISLDEKTVSIEEFKELASK